MTTPITGYTASCLKEVVTYEFILPLTREAQLRDALDQLFFIDTVTERVREIGLARFEAWLPRDGDSDADYLQAIIERVSQSFGGYSISHVNGRYRRGPLVARRDAIERQLGGNRYLVDETTAIVRFLVPVPASETTYRGVFDEVDDPLRPGQFAQDVALIHHLFFALFVEEVISTVRGEDEIWLVEQWSGGRQLYAFRATG